MIKSELTAYYCPYKKLFLIFWVPKYVNAINSLEQLYCLHSIRDIFCLRNLEDWAENAYYLNVEIEMIKNLVIISEQEKTTY